MAIDPLDNWKTQAEAAAILKCSQKTIGRMATQKKIQRVLRRVPGRTPMPVFNPGAVEHQGAHPARAAEGRAVARLSAGRLLWPPRPDQRS